MDKSIWEDGLDFKIKRTEEEIVVAAEALVVANARFQELVTDLRKLRKYQSEQAPSADV